jgi:hypothetical protein
MFDPRLLRCYTWKYAAAGGIQSQTVVQISLPLNIFVKYLSGRNDGERPVASPRDATRVGIETY